MSEAVKQVSSMKLEITNQKNIVFPTVHIYAGATDEELEIVRKQCIDQFKKLIAETEKEGFTVAGGTVQ